MPSWRWSFLKRSGVLRFSGAGRQDANMQLPGRTVARVRDAPSLRKNNFGATLIGVGPARSDQPPQAVTAISTRTGGSERAAEPVSRAPAERSASRELRDVEAHKTSSSPKRRGGARLWIPVGFAAASALALGYRKLSEFESTDDAQIDANLTGVSARVAATVVKIHVGPNQLVHEGELLAELDPRDSELAVQTARANLARAAAVLESERPSLAIMETGEDTGLKGAQAELASAEAALVVAARDINQLQAQLAEAHAQFTHAASERERAVKLLHEGALADADRDTRVRAADVAEARAMAAAQSLAAGQARLAQLQSSARAARERVNERKANAPRRLESQRAAVSAAQAAFQLAQAQLEQALAQLSDTKLYAPVAGQIGPKSINTGEAVTPGQQLFTICPTQELWVTANFRETQLQHMHPGQRATVYADALDRSFTGKVESFAGATGSRFSLLPPENASGNYVKVVQRVPVRIRLDPGQPGGERLRAGMSVEPEVKVR